MNGSGMRAQHYINTQKARGITLIELVIAIALLSILLTIGVPSFSNLIASNHLVTKNNLFVSDLNTARSEAIRRGRSVSVCKSSDGANCSTDAAVGYEAGWIMFAEQPAHLTGSTLGSRDVNNEDLLRVQPAMASAYTLRGSRRFSNFISYLPSGELANPGAGNTSDHFILCRDRLLDRARAVFVISTGRIHLARDANNNRQPEDISGADLTTCTPA